MWTKAESGRLRRGPNGKKVIRIDLPDYAKDIDLDVLEGLCNYLVNHEYPGRFLEGILSWDFRVTMNAICDESEGTAYAYCIGGIWKLIYNSIPGTYHGSKDIFNGHLRRKTINAS